MTTTLFHSLTYADPITAIAFLEAVGFTRRAVFTDDANPEVVVHAQFDWGSSGGVMLGSRRADRSNVELEGWIDSVGHGQCYCVVERDEEVDDVFDRAIAAGASPVQAPVSPEYGGRTCTVRDPEGNQWSFGSYPGE